MDNLRVMITPRETGLIRKIAAEIYHTYCTQGSTDVMTREDLYHYGVVGLLEAKKNFDASRNVPWLAFAAFRIRGAMLDQLRVQPLIRLPQAVRKRVKELNRAKAELCDAGLESDAQILADRLGWSVQEVHRVTNLSISLVPAADSAADGDEPGACPGWVLVDAAPDPEAQTLRKEVAGLVRKCLALLPSAEDRLVIVGRILEGLKLREIAQTLGCSAENVRQRQKKVEKSIKTCIQQHGWAADG